MSIYHDEVEIEDFEYDEDDEMYYYPCPCGDRFQITKVFKQLKYFWLLDPTANSYLNCQPPDCDLIPLFPLPSFPPMKRRDILTMMT